MPSKAGRRYLEAEIRRRQEVQAEAPDRVVPQRGHKDRKRWCGGKVGREHQPEIVLYHGVSGFECRWIPRFMWRYGERTLISERGHYLCRHAIRCSKCGRYMEVFLSVDKCPDAPK